MRQKQKPTGRTPVKQPAPSSPTRGPNSTRRRVLEAARGHFFHHGFRNVTMDDLAAELGVSKKTLYAHFPGKDALLEAVLNDEFARVSSRLAEARASSLGDFGVALQTMLGAMQEELTELRPPFVRDMRMKAPHVFERLQKRRAKLIETHFGALFRAGQRSGDVRRDIPATLMIESILAAIHAIMNPAKLADLQLSPREAFGGVIGIVLRGVLQPGKGKR
ncbi:MAG: TetR/AcrR family transcriptional regulator [Chthoniobacterales bacterium]